MKLINIRQGFSLLGAIACFIPKAFSVPVDYPSITFTLNAVLGHAPYHIYNARLTFRGYYLANFGEDPLGGTFNQLWPETTVHQDNDPIPITINIPAARVNEPEDEQVTVLERWLTLLLTITYEYNDQTHNQDAGMLFALYLTRNTPHARWEVRLQPRRRRLAYDWPLPAGRVVDLTLPRRLQLRIPPEFTRFFNFNLQPPLNFVVERGHFGIVPNAGILADITQLSIGQI